MSDPKALLEREERHWELPPGAFDRLMDRRDRRRRTQRIAAVALTLLLLAAAIGGAVLLVRSSEREVPAGPIPTASLAPNVSGSALDGYAETRFPEMGPAHDLAVAPDGTIWGAGRSVVTHFDGETWTTYFSDDGLPLGREGWVLSVEVAPDGTVWAGTEGGLARLDGATWTAVSPSVQMNPIAFAPDGSVVVAVEPEPKELGTSQILRFDGETWSTVGGDQYPGSLVNALDVAPDGTVWVADWNWFFGSVWRFDGSAWTDWRFAFDGSAWTTWTTRAEGDGLLTGFVHALTVAPDGTVWATAELAPSSPPGVPALARFDGDGWAFFPIPGAERFDWDEGTGGLALGPDGTLWIAHPFSPSPEGRSVLFSFDGSTWTRDDLPVQIETLEVGPDGTLWVALDDSLVRYVPPAE